MRANDVYKKLLICDRSFVCVCANQRDPRRYFFQTVKIWNMDGAGSYDVHESKRLAPAMTLHPYGRDIPASIAACDPVEWKLEGSKDYLNWFLLDEKAASHPDADVSNFVRKRGSLVSHHTGDARKDDVSAPEHDGLTMDPGLLTADYGHVIHWSPLHASLAQPGIDVRVNVKASSTIESTTLHDDEAARFEAHTLARLLNARPAPLHSGLLTHLRRTQWLHLAPTGVT